MGVLEGSSCGGVPEEEEASAGEPKSKEHAGRKRESPIRSQKTEDGGKNLKQVKMLSFGEQEPRSLQTLQHLFIKNIYALDPRR